MNETCGSRVLAFLLICPGFLNAFACLCSVSFTCTSTYICQRCNYYLFASFVLIIFACARIQLFEKNSDTDRLSAFSRTLKSILISVYHDFPRLRYTVEHGLLRSIEWYISHKFPTCISQETSFRTFQEITNWLRTESHGAVKLCWLIRYKAHVVLFCSEKSAGFNGLVVVAVFVERIFGKWIGKQIFFDPHFVATAQIDSEPNSSCIIITARAVIPRVQQKQS